MLASLLSLSDPTSISWFPGLQYRFSFDLCIDGLIGFAKKWTFFSPSFADSSWLLQLLLLQVTLVLHVKDGPLRKGVVGENDWICGDFHCFKGSNASFEAMLQRPSKEGLPEKSKMLKYFCLIYWMSEWMFGETKWLCVPPKLWKPRRECVFVILKEQKFFVSP